MAYYEVVAQIERLVERIVLVKADSPEEAHDKIMNSAYIVNESLIEERLSETMSIQEVQYHEFIYDEDESLISEYESSPIVDECDCLCGKCKP